MAQANDYALRHYPKIHVCSIPTEAAGKYNLLMEDDLTSETPHIYIYIYVFLFRMSNPRHEYRNRERELDLSISVSFSISLLTNAVSTAVHTESWPIFLSPLAIHFNNDNTILTFFLKPSRYSSQQRQQQQKHSTFLRANAEHLSYPCLDDFGR